MWNISNLSCIYLLLNDEKSYFAHFFTCEMSENKKSQIHFSSHNFRKFFTKKKSHKFLKNNFLRNVYFKFLVMLHILFLDITEHEWFSRSYYPTLEMNKIKQNRLVVFPLMTIFQFFFCRWVGPWKRKVQSHFWWTGPDFCWNVWLLKKPSSSQLSPSSSPLNFLIPI